ncbi:glycosyltransferase family 61 protein [Photobacterium damselae]|uniref:glycosyltransferase family 61 protein n=1 Tax=Photobacterium damselae TaxID=38293 RepID=UPI00406980CE
MYFKRNFINLIKKILSVRLVNIDDDFILNNKSIKKYKLKKISGKRLWGGEPNSLFNDDNSKFYKGYISNIEIKYFELESNDYFLANNHLMDIYFRCYYEKNISYIPALSKLPIKKNITKLSGTCAYLSNTEPQHYGHFIMFVLPLLYWYKRYSSSEPEYYYLGDVDLKSFHYELLSLAGIKREQIIIKPCRADKIIYCSLTRKKYKNKKYWDHESYSYIYDLIKDKKSKNMSRKLYISRGDVKWRKVENENILLSYLVNKGFECVSMDGKSLDEQISLFSEASCIVAPHGAALTNLLYCNENTNVIELFPFNYPDVTSYVFATYSKCNYYRLEGEAIDLSNEACYRNIYVDINKLDEILKLVD